MALAALTFGWGLGWQLSLIASATLSRCIRSKMKKCDQLRCLTLLGVSAQWNMLSVNAHCQ